MCARINHSFITSAHLCYPHYCNAIARLLRNIRRTTDPPPLCYTPYNIGDGNIVSRPRARDNRVRTRRLFHLRQSEAVRRHGDPCRYLRGPSPVSTSRCRARQCRRRAACHPIARVCVPLDAAVTRVTCTCPARRGCHSCDVEPSRSGRRSGQVPTDLGCESTYVPPVYVLKQQSEERNTVFYSYLACFVNTLIDGLARGVGEDPDKYPRTWEVRARI